MKGLATKLFNFGGLTKWYIDQAKTATLLTTRCSGSSYLNKVELQNGCLSLGHSKTSTSGKNFIKTTSVGMRATKSNETR